MNKLTNINYIKELLGKYDFKFSKQLGQNFLINPSVCPKMAQGSGCEGIGVIEIGPGIGTLTCELAKIAKKVIAIELDTRLRPVLETTLKDFDNVFMIYGDVLKLNLHQIIEDNFIGMDVVICANLPYYITSPIVMSLLESRLPIKAVTVMVQKEAAERLTARVGTRAAGAVTVAVSYYSTAQKLFDVNRGSFMPSPNVDSSVIKLDVLSEPPFKVNNEKMFFRTVKSAFAQRRKTLPNSLSAGLSIGKDQICSALDECGIKLTARAEELTMEQFSNLSNVLLLKVI